MLRTMNSKNGTMKLNSTEPISIEDSERKSVATVTSTRQRPYISTGIGFLVSGAIIASVSQFVIQMNWLTAMGIAMVIIALVMIALGRTIPKLSPEASLILMETGTDNIASLLEELGISSKAIYLPPSSVNTRPQALIPLQEKPINAQSINSLPQR